jgi:transketolase N-terminal domain/subunit
MHEANLGAVERRSSARSRLLQMHYEACVGHIGGNLSALDILLSLYHDVMGPEDQFVLSKGHAAGALYVTLWSLGRLNDDDLKTFHKDRTRLPGHPPTRGLNDVLFATGSCRWPPVWPSPSSCGANPAASSASRPTANGTKAPTGRP